MFDSGVTAETLISDLKETLDVALPISDALYIAWLNELEQFLYTEIIREQATELKKGTDAAGASAIIVGRLDLGTLGERIKNAATVRFEDIIAVYFVDSTNIYEHNSPRITQLIKTTAAGGATFPNTYFKVVEETYGADLTLINNDVLGYRLEKNTEKNNVGIRIIYIIRPVLKSVNNIQTQNVMLPPEFVSLARAKLSGEAYKWVNEDAIAAKWLNDYNVLLETFKQWMTSKQPAFGWRG